MKTIDEILDEWYPTIPDEEHNGLYARDKVKLIAQDFADQLRGLEWIAIKDKKPADYDRVLYFDSRGKGAVCVGYFVWSQTPVNYVTHWMKLPAFPVL